MEWLANTCACGTAALGVPLFEVGDYNFQVVAERGHMLRCPACGSLYPDRFPSKESLSGAYARYYTGERSRSRVRSLLRAVLSLGRGAYLRRSTPLTASPVLDYGCGSGEFLAALRLAGHRGRLVGTDLLPAAASLATQFEWVELDEFDAQRTSYQWVTLGHVVEHLSEPETIVRRLAGVMADDGALWLATPNADSLLIARFGACARDLDFPRHRQVFSRPALERLLGRAGFDTPEFRASPRVNTLLNFGASARNLWRYDPRSKVVKAGAVVVALAVTLLHLALPRPVRARTAPELVVVARRAARSQRNDLRPD
jgi:SAM-dependent methyltransferase